MGQLQIDILWSNITETQAKAILVKIRTFISQNAGTQLVNQMYTETNEG